MYNKTNIIKHHHNLTDDLIDDIMSPTDDVVFRITILLKTKALRVIRPTFPSIPTLRYKVRLVPVRQT